MPKQKVSTKYIIKQSLKVFRTKGYYATSMKDIADACELQKGSLYHHFGSKEDLMKAVIGHLHEYYRREVFAHAYDGRLGGRQKLRQLADISEEQFFSSKSGCLMGNLALEMAGHIDRFAEQVRGFFTDWTAALAHIFREKFDAKTAQELARQSVANIEGAIMMMNLFGDQNYLKQAHKEILQKWDSPQANAPA